MKKVLTLVILAAVLFWTPLSFPVSGHAQSTAANPDSMVPNPEAPSPISPADACPALTTFPAGASPSAAAPAAVAVDSARDRIYVVHNQEFVVNALPTNRVSVVDATSGNIITTVPVGKNPEGIALDTSQNLVYVTNADDNTVSVISGASNTVIATINVGQHPHGIAVDSQAGLVYVANTMGKSVSVINSSSNTVVSVDIGASAWSVAVDPSTHLAYVSAQAAPWTIYPINGQTGTKLSGIQLSLLFSLKNIAIDPGNLLYVSDHDTGAVAIVDISSSPLKETQYSRFHAGTYPDSLAIDPNTGLLYVADSATSQVKVFDSAGSLKGSVATLRLPDAIAFNSPARRAYVADQGSDSLTVINADTKTLDRTIVLGTFVPGLAIDPTSGTNGILYAANYPADAISKIDIATRTLMASWPSGPGPWAVAVDPGLKQVYSLNYIDQTVTVLDSATGQVKGQPIPVGNKPIIMAVNPATHMVYVTGHNDNSLSVIDGTRNSLVTTLWVGSGPAGIAIDQSANIVYVANQLDGTISIIDGAKNQVTGSSWTLPQGYKNAWGLALDPGLHQLYYTNPPPYIGDFSGLGVLNTDSGMLIAHIPSPSRADLVAVNTVNHQVFMTDSDANTVSIIHGTSNTSVRTVNVGNEPITVLADQGSGLAYVDNALDGTVSIIQPCSAPAPTPTPTPTATSVPTATATSTPLATPAPSAGDNSGALTGPFTFTLNSGQSANYEIKFRNTGTATWWSSQGYILKEVETGVSASLGSAVGSGGCDGLTPTSSCTWPWTVHAGTNAGTHTVHYRMYHGADGFGDSITLTLTVVGTTPPPPTATPAPIYTPPVYPPNAVIKDSSFQVQNLSDTNAANIELRYYSPDGIRVATENVSIPKSSSLLRDSRGGPDPMPTSLPPGFAGSVEVVSDQAIVTSMNVFKGDNAADGYNGATLSDASRNILLPLVYGYGSRDTWHTHFTVQDPNDYAAGITMTYADGITGQVTNTVTDTIPAHGSRSYDQSSLAFFFGSVSIISDQPVVAEVSEVYPNVLITYTGFNRDTEAANKVYLPYLFKGTYWNTAIQLQNVDPSKPAAVTVEVTDQNTGAKYSSTQTVTTSRSYDFRGSSDATTGGLNVPPGFVGSGVITSTQPVVAVVNEMLNFPGESLDNIHKAMSYKGVPQGTSTRTLLPILYRQNPWGCSFQVQNMGSSPTTVTIVARDQYTGATYSTTQVVNTAKTFDIRFDETWANGGLALPLGFYGSAVVSADQPITVVLNQEDASNNGADMAIANNGFQPSGSSRGYLPLAIKGSGENW